MRAILREPLVHFVAIGVLLFAVDALRRGEEDERKIVVSRLLREELGDERRIDAWIDEEVLYREGLRRGFAEDDPQVRARVASQMRFVLASRTIVDEPTEDELRAYYDAHRDAYAEGTRVSFTHVFIQGDDEAAEARAGELLELLRGGASPAGLGDRFSGGRRYRQREVADLAETFGDSFAGGLAAQPVESWELRRSRFGLHLVRVDEVLPAESAPFERVREDVRGALLEEKREAAVQNQVAALRAQFDVVRQP